MTDHLKEAKEIVEIAEHLTDDHSVMAIAYAQVAQTHALIALVERLTFDGQKGAYIDRADYAAAMDEVEATIGTRVRTCPYCSGEECSH